jgi:uncharacterized protein
MKWTIDHDPAVQRFVAHVDGEQGTLEYERDGNVMVITHVRVPEAIGNRGIAAALTETALGFARDQGWHVVPRCPYADAYVARHPQWADIVAR